jgi:hypothetical protein
MKRFLGSALILALLSIPAFAGSNSQTLILAHTVKAGATELPAGDYKVSWTGTGNSVQVTIAGRGIAPVTLTAKLVEQKHDHAGVITNSVSGTSVLQTIELSKVSLIVQDSTAGGQ